MVTAGGSAADWLCSAVWLRLTPASLVLMQEEMLGRVQEGEWGVLVMDPQSTRIMSAACRISEILNYGVACEHQALPGCDSWIVLAVREWTLHLLSMHLRNQAEVAINMLRNSRLPTPHGCPVGDVPHWWTACSYGANHSARWQECASLVA